MSIEDLTAALESIKFSVTDNSRFSGVSGFKARSFGVDEVSEILLLL